MIRRISQLLTIGLILVLTTACGNAYVASLDVNPWVQATVNSEQTMLDLAFTDDPAHGWMVGKGSTVMETTDGGLTWDPVELDLLSDRAYTLTAVSFSGDEGWIIGAPSILLHTDDGGNAWVEVPLSEQLPGLPNTILALGPNAAEMTTDVGAIYQTKDSGLHWQALVQEAVGVVRNISRSADGRYVAVSSRGNFYSTWEPGQAAWVQHNRTSSRRLQSVGFGLDNELWLIARGGAMQFTAPGSYEDWGDPITPEFATSWGLLDAAYRTPDELWVTGGSGNLLLSRDGGQTWLKDRAVEQVPGNFYIVRFITPEQGFILGQNGVLLKYDPELGAKATSA